jgi:hypothetical protein
MDTTTERSLPNTPLLVTGAVVLGASYGASAISAALSDRESIDQLYYPVAGPWLALDKRDCDLEACDNETLDTTLLIGSGVLHGIGALGVLLSIVGPETTTKRWYLIGNNDVVVAPVMTPSNAGLTAIGRPPLSFARNLPPPRARGEARGALRRARAIERADRRRVSDG